MSPVSKTQIGRSYTLPENELPVGWDSTPIKSLATLRKGKKPNKVDKIPWPGAVPYIDIEAFEKRNIRRYADPKSSTLVDEGEVTQPPAKPGA